MQLQNDDVDDELVSDEQVVADALDERVDELVITVEMDEDDERLEIEMLLTQTYDEDEEIDCYDMVVEVDELEDVARFDELVQIDDETDVSILDDDMDVMQQIMEVDDEVEDIQTATLVGIDEVDVNELWMFVI